MLLTAYADTDAAIAAINQVGLDHYLMKPWDPPEERLYPVLDDLLDDWSRARGPRSKASASPARAGRRRATPRRSFSRANQVPYQWLDVDDDASARELLVGSLRRRRRGCPSCSFPTARMLVAPTNAELAAKIGLQTQAQRPFYDVDHRRRRARGTRERRVRARPKDCIRC